MWGFLKTFATFPKSAPFSTRKKLDKVYVFQLSHKNSVENSALFSSVSKSFPHPFSKSRNCTSCTKSLFSTIKCHRKRRIFRPDRWHFLPFFRGAKPWLFATVTTGVSCVRAAVFLPLFRRLSVGKQRSALFFRCIGHRSAP